MINDVVYANLCTGIDIRVVKRHTSRLGIIIVDYISHPDSEFRRNISY